MFHVKKAGTYRHSHIIQRMFLRFGIENVAPDDQGFLTDSGIFLSREDASKRQRVIRRTV